MSAITFALVMQRAECLHSLSHARKLLQRACTWFTFRFWAYHTPAKHAASMPSRIVFRSSARSRRNGGFVGRKAFYAVRKLPFWSPIRGPQHKNTCLSQVHLTRKCRNLTVQVKNSSSDDFTMRCVSQARDLEEAALEGCSSRLFSLLRLLKPYVPSRRLRLRDVDGFPASSNFRERHIVRERFKERLGGVESTIAALVQEDRDCAVSDVVANSTTTRTLSDIPSYNYLVYRHSHAKKNGTGEQCLGGEVNRLLPRATASIRHPLAVKAALFIRLPVMWLGGCLVELWKKKGDQASIASYRDITLTDLSSKDFGAFVRAAILTAASHLLRQCPIWCRHAWRHHRLMPPSRDPNFLDGKAAETQWGSRLHRHSISFCCRCSSYRHTRFTSV